MPTCFIISPIGETGSEIRQNADDLRDLIIKPALESFGFEVIRGDHRSEPGQIDVDVIRAVQESDLCIVDISLPNPNVFYEFGRRDETGKPVILLKAKDSGELPVDIATRRYIEYDLDARRGIINAVTQLKSFVEPLVKRGFESTTGGASLLEISETLKRLERKVDRIGHGAARQDAVTPVKPGGESVDPNVDPVDLFRLALRRRNLPMAEKAMDLLAYRMNRHRWLDQVVEQVAAMGSIRAGDLLIENALEFMDEAANFHEKVDYIGYLVSNLNRTDRELENLALVEELCNSVLAVAEAESTDPDDRVQPYNQLNRLYHGIYGNTGDKMWLEKAMRVLQKALQISDQLSFLYYNLSMCERKRNEPGDKELALEHVLRCIELDGDKQDDDHLNDACELLHDLGDPRLDDYMDMLERVNSVKAQLLRERWLRGQ